MLENKKNISEYNIQFTQIATDVFFVLKNSKTTQFFSMNSFKNTLRPNWEIQMD